MPVEHLQGLAYHPRMPWHPEHVVGQPVGMKVTTRHGDYQRGPAEQAVGVAGTVYHALRKRS